jgi:hypothetical protein
MSLRLKAAALLVRGRMITPWLELVDHAVCDRFSSMIGDDAEIASITGVRMPRKPDEYRMAMAGKHAQLADMLVERSVGVNEAREAMYAAGVDLGSGLRSQLRLDGGEDDLLAAARLLYRVLGIEFDVVRGVESTRMVVRRCSLSERYSPRTCEVISAMDEGVVEGLNPRARMTFTRRNSPSDHPCEAVLTWRPGE